MLTILKTNVASAISLPSHDINSVRGMLKADRSCCYEFTNFIGKKRWDLRRVLSMESVCDGTAAFKMQENQSDIERSGSWRFSEVCGRSNDKAKDLRSWHGDTLLNNRGYRWPRPWRIWRTLEISGLYVELFLQENRISRTPTPYFSSIFQMRSNRRNV